MKINSNIQGMISQTILSRNEAKLSVSTERMSSGYKINKSKDNPAGMAISNRMRAQLKSLDRANKNAQNAVSAVQTAEGAMSEIEEMLQRMNELAIKSSNGTMTSEDRKAIQEEVDQLTSEIARVSKSATFNSQGLLDGSQALKAYTQKSDTLTVRGYNELFDADDYQVSFDANGRVSLTKGAAHDPVQITSQDVVPFTDKDDNITGYSTTVHTVDGGEITIDLKGSAAVADVDMKVTGLGGMKIQVGAEEGQEIRMVIPEVSLKTLNLIDLNGDRTIDCRTQEGSKKAIERINSAIDYVSAARSKVGAYQNRVENTISNLDITTENLTQSYSVIKDIDMAEGMVDYTRLQVLVQAGTTMLSQANEQPQQALQLLQ
ncbi:MAG: flagellin [Lachnospiraceae bacterium]|nr:flagellin [Lachnospiraceae bacterium]